MTATGFRMDCVFYCDDPESYEYGSADRAAQFHGPMHWGLARPALVAKIGG